MHERKPSEFERVLGPITRRPDEVNVWLRLEGLTLLCGSVVVYLFTGLPAWFLAVFLLAPDVSLLAYRLNPRVGAVAYNFFHNAAFPVMLGVAGVVTNAVVLTMIALVWAAHVGLDRALGFGLKYASSYHDTHLVNRSADFSGRRQ